MKTIYVFALAALLSTAASAQTPAPAMQPAAQQPTGERPAMVKGAHYPNIMDAQKALETAKQHLQKAPHDFGGHRTKAVELIDKAMAELKEAIKWNEEQEKGMKK